MEDAADLLFKKFGDRSSSSSSSEDDDDDDDVDNQDGEDFVQASHETNYQRLYFEDNREGWMIPLKKIRQMMSFSDIPKSHHKCCEVS